jgi:hypothetical protein
MNKQTTFTEADVKHSFSRTPKNVMTYLNGYEAIIYDKMYDKFQSRGYKPFICSVSYLVDSTEFGNQKVQEVLKKLIELNYIKKLSSDIGKTSEFTMVTEKFNEFENLKSKKIIALKIKKNTNKTKKQPKQDEVIHKSKDVEIIPPVTIQTQSVVNSTAIGRLNNTVNDVVVNSDEVDNNDTDVLFLDSRETEELSKNHPVISEEKDSLSTMLKLIDLVKNEGIEEFYIIMDNKMSEQEQAILIEEQTIKDFKNRLVDYFPIEETNVILFMLNDYRLEKQTIEV